MLQQNLARVQDPPWLVIMLAELGVRETPGEKATPRIQEYHKWTTLPAKMADSDETAWCSSCMNFCLGSSGHPYTRSAGARSWERYGHALPKLARGCIIVLSRGDDPRFGHVALLLEANDRSINLIGGNQGNAVSVRTYARSRIVAQRWPTTYPLPAML